MVLSGCRSLLGSGMGGEATSHTQQARPQEGSRRPPCRGMHCWNQRRFSQGGARQPEGGELGCRRRGSWPCPARPPHGYVTLSRGLPLSGLFFSLRKTQAQQSFPLTSPGTHGARGRLLSLRSLPPPPPQAQDPQAQAPSTPGPRLPSL